ncbi:SURF-family protein Shy1 [Lindgomyces ingoldianus]|uniref:SURF-family protein Shy1 n=1 Tax=Lindgomyces ingoldianus TaxID=673940 RepID=A0ACB6RAF9_9PLEO|nr:SURF-family protein Shy1 [Lindgomyces ingoldianus]KAF2476263.1 SURF-family protein Shy1 [Lindgomyces ingoldianus]
MSRPNPFLNLFRRYYSHHGFNANPKMSLRPSTRAQCPRQRFHDQFRLHQMQFRRRMSSKPDDGPTPLDPNFISILDRPTRMARVGKQHGPGLIILAIIPIAAFCLGCWQVQRLGWKTELVARFEDRLTFPPLELPLRVDPDAIKDFDYRKVWAKGVLRHDQEILIGPRLHEGEDGYIVVTPLEREDSRGRKSKILCCRGWINKNVAKQWYRKQNGALPEGEVVIEGLLRQPPKGNMFTPQNFPEEGKWFFPDVQQMAEYTGSQAVWVEETMTPDLLVSYEREPKGIPIGRPATVNLRNNHTQYIFTWYALSLATSIMFWMVVKKPLSGTQRRVKHSLDWS